MTDGPKDLAPEWARIPKPGTPVVARDLTGWEDGDDRSDREIRPQS